jgi:uncharacterized protein (TIGR03067 family)
MPRLHFATIAILFLLPRPALADDKADKAKAEEFKALKSEWTVAKATLAGDDAFEFLKVLEFTIHDDGKYTAKHGEVRDEGVFTLDLSATPKSMVIKPTGGPSKDKVLTAIYKLDGDTLTICYDMDGKVNPTKFESTAENKFLLVEYKRKK